MEDLCESSDWYRFEQEAERLSSIVLDLKKTWTDNVADDSEVGYLGRPFSIQ